ncbi:LysR family transcriptional regulator [Pandoraea sp.]|uniref:LysR family transcriptional regulator n=1 Tax=Pandoraea sp. TaxID=1883445 RepID=UPI00122732C6|nr:LysR family transcriptional regulator [Pandoraea sp.]MBU6491848.1 LysR family transcriptional regulator [Burkholderiales bacterium]MDE2289455.1 LysR family transcriptional regulator [Burkholderiales bacterium]MDE2608809.1 LysR family transcriptional regulator [Burkholderiales bacterium]TAL55039.1 MAG: LysR family transcriptional regulator [Pandoraea sp.]TAM19912.1 MAG: LysR family transcriptional regulator [Pandoraea sp.]
MDVELARTFLQVVKTGSLVAAAARLHVTQTAVTARIKNLESQLGCRLFERNKAGAKLTADGEKFLGYAGQLVQTWEAARRNLPLPSGHDDVFTFGAEASLATPLVLHWAARMRRDMTNYGIRAELGDGSALQQKVRSGALDAALVYEPEYAPGIQVEQVLEEKLIQICAVHSPSPYVYVDWGPEFRRQHDAALPEHARGPLYFNLGPLALQYILQFGGSGYFRTRVVSLYLDRGVMERVKDAPEFSYPIYLVYLPTAAGTAVDAALRILRQIVAEDADWSQRWDYLT